MAKAVPVRFETDADWAWCDLVIISAMIIHKQGLRKLIQKGVEEGRLVRRASASGGSGGDRPVQTPFAAGIPGNSGDW